MDQQDRIVGWVIAELAGRSHGVVTRRQLLAAGVTPEEIRSRLAARVLIQVHPGVYRVGHLAQSVEASYVAAVLACGDGALLCGHAAAYLYAVIKGRGFPLPEVVAPTERRVTGIRVKRSRVPLEPDAAMHRGIPVTSVARTLVDLAGALSLGALARACHEAEVLHRTTPAEIDAVLARRPRSKGARKVRRVIQGDAPVLLSRLEAQFRKLLAAAGLPLPDTNKRVGGRYVDCRWTTPPLTVELDSYRFHHSRHAWEQDRRRDREARARGDEYRRYTYGDVFEGPQPMLAELHALLLPPKNPA